MMNLKEVVKPAVGFIKSLKAKDTIAIVHGHDCDSITSAAILFKLIKSLTKKGPELVISEQNSGVTEGTFTRLKRLKPTHTIIVDIPNIPVGIETKLRNITNVLIIDHHVPKGYAKITYVNPRIFDRDSYLPVAYLCFRIYDEMLGAKNIAWIAGIGTLSDMGMKNCQDLFDRIRKESRDLVDNLDNDDELLMEKSLLGKMTKTVDSCMVVKDIPGSVFALKVLIDSKGHNDVMKNATMKKYSKAVEDEFAKLQKDFEKNKKISEGMVAYEIKSAMRLKSAFANYLERNFQDSVVVVYQKEKMEYNFSLRRGRNVSIDLDSIAKEAVRGIEGANGGGHPAAAGLRVQISQFKPIFENLRLKIKLESTKTPNKPK